MSEDTLETAFYNHVDACVDYVTIQPSYATGGSTVAEAFRIVVNALKFILFGDEQAYEFVTTPESFNEQALTDTLVWVHDNIKTTDSAHMRVTRLNMFITGTQCAR